MEKKSNVQLIGTWKMSYEGIDKGIELLKQGENIHQAIVQAIKVVEDDDSFVSVGRGGLPNRDGIVELDAAYMNGDTLGIGGVIAVKNIKHPIEAAFHLSQGKRNCILAQGGAEEFAARKGLEFCNMQTANSDIRYKKAKAEFDEAQSLGAYEGHDTVCMIGRSQEGTLACGVSTSGLFMKHPGRVGDSPLPGCGFYADSKIGSAAATGVGEDIMKGCLSYSIVFRMRIGSDVQTACEMALREHIDALAEKGQYVGSMSVIAMDKDGNIGAATNLDAFPFVVGSVMEGCCIYKVCPAGGSMIIEVAKESWLKEYKGD